MLFRRFHKTAKGDYRLVMYVHPPVRKEQLGSHWTNFHENWNLSTFFRKSIENLQVSLKSGTIKRYFIWRRMYVYDIFRLIFIRIRNISDKIVEKIKTYFLFGNFSPEIRARLWDNVKKKYVISRQATDDNVKRRMFFTYWISKVIETHSEYVILIASISTVKFVSRTRLSVTLICILSVLFVRRSSFSENRCFRKGPRVRPFVLLARTTLMWVQSIGEMILTGRRPKNSGTSRVPSSSTA